MKHARNAVSWLHRFAAAVALAAFTLIVVEALASSSFTLLSERQPLAEAPYELGYHTLALATVIGATLLAVWLWQSQSKRYVKLLGAITAAVAILQALALGGSSMAQWTPRTGAIHTCLADAVFSLSLCLALFTRTDWRWNETAVADVAAPSLRNLLTLTTAIIFAESILGAGLSHGIIGTPPHVWTGLLATFSALWALEVALNKFSQVPAVKIPSILLAEAVVLQLFLGLVAHSMALNARVSPQPLPGLPVINATHAAAGALALAASLFATFQAFKYLAPAASLEAARSSAERESKSQKGANTDEPLRIKSEGPLNPERTD
ncbi:MAG: hypothetical protein ABSB82_08795 [Terriglobia bacterium]|jgi:hypothetical protein